MRKKKQKSMVFADKDAYSLDSISTSRISRKDNTLPISLGKIRNSEYWIMIVLLFGVIATGIAIYQVTANNIRRSFQPTIEVAKSTIVSLSSQKTPTLVQTTIKTQIIEVTPTIDSNVVRIESIPSSSFPYYDSSLDRDAAKLTIRTELGNEEMINNYMLDFVLPEDGKDRGVGFYIDFNEGLDLSEYKYLRFTVAFSDADANIGIFLKDSEGNTSWYYLPSTLPLEKPVVVKLADFSGKTSLNTIKTVQFHSSGVLTHGKHKISIRDIRFTKE